jgi:hypothetical protein
VSEWRDDAACRDEDLNLFYPKSEEVLPPAVERLCSSCPVEADCLAWALRHEDHGMWARTTPKKRSRLRRAAGIPFTRLESMARIRGAAPEEEAS